VAPPVQGAAPDAVEPDRLAADLGMTLAGVDARVSTGASAADACGLQRQPVVRMVLNERVLFDTDSDQPRVDGGPVLDQLAAVVKRDAPGGEVTVVGHTDAMGSDAYNIALSRRRSDKVIRALVERGLDASRLSAVAVGKRQPLASDATADGRARNRRVEFLISRCAAANLDVVRQTGGIGPAAEVLRLDGGYGVRTVGSVPLDPVPVAAPAAEQPAAPVQPLRPVRPPAVIAQPQRQPHYQPRTLSPQVQPNALGPAVPF
jgi:outer membrane protein OmpA-like peptidoglycan-associated protein